MILSEVDSLSNSLLTDNYTDRLLPTLYPATRALMINDDQFLPPPPPVAEHGFSDYIMATSYFEPGEAESSNKTSKEYTVIFDCGSSENGVIHNANILGIDLKSIHV